MNVFKIIKKFCYYMLLGIKSPYILIKNLELNNINVYKYYVLSNNKKEVGFIKIKNEDKIENFLLTENKQLIKYKTNKLIKYRFRNINKELNNKTIIFILNHLTTYLNSGNNLIESFTILINNVTDIKLELILRNIRYKLMSGSNLKDALASEEDVFKRLLINEIDVKDEKKSLIEIKEDYIKLYDINTNIKKASFYKFFIFPYLVLVISFLLKYVIPQFYEKYLNLVEVESGMLYRINLFCNNISSFLNIIILLSLSFLLILIICFFFIRSIYEKKKIFINKKLYLNQQLYIYFKTLSSVLKYNLINKNDIGIVTYDEDYQKLLIDSIESYNKENVISPVIKGNNSISDKTYKMILTGEKFDSLLLQINNIYNYYYKEVKELTNKRIKNYRVFLTIISMLLFFSILSILIIQFLIMIK